MTYPYTRKDAKSIQSIFYFTGKSCPKGHISTRYTSSSKCVTCVKENQKINGNLYSEKSRNKNRIKNNLKSKEEYRKIGKKYVYLMWSRAKKRALEKNIPFDILLEDINIPDMCPVLGVHFIISNSGQGPGDLSPSLDRIIPKLGYVKDNIQIISFKANRIKSDADINDLEKVLNYMKSIKTKYCIEPNNKNNDGVSND